jgi:hypothetical protein
VSIRSLVRHLVGAHVVVGAVLFLSASQPHAAPAVWARVDHDALRGGGHVVYVTDVLPADGSGSPWLAVGFVVDSDGNREPSAWTSSDGVTWRRFAMESTGSSERRDGAIVVARRGNVAVALGDRFDGRLRTAAWSSTSPSSWTVLKDPLDPLLAYDGHVALLTAGPEGFVAVGVRHTATNSVVTVFRSEDGRAWSVDTGFARVGEGFQPLGVSVTSDRLVIVGDTATGSGADGRIWVGTKGQAWTRVEPAPLGLDGAGLQQVAGIVWDPTFGYVAGGMTTQLGVEVPTLWSSPDGLTWERLAPLVDTGAAAIHQIVAVPGGFLASGDSDSGPRIWRSSNGRDWSPVPAPSYPSEGGVKVSLAFDGTKLVLLETGQYGSKLFQREGSTWKRGDRGAAFPASTPFASELRDVAVANGRLVAVGNDGHERPIVMYSRRGTAWRKAAFTDRAARLLAVTSDRSGFTIAGWRLIKGRARLAIWTSRTGTAWRRLGGTQYEPVGVFVDIARDSTGLVAVALEPSQRGFVVSVWKRGRSQWISDRVLGAGEARAVCVGPHGATAVATVGVGPRSRVLAWSRAGNGAWSAEPELVAASASAEGCADGPKGTVIVGSDGPATTWRRTRPGAPWNPSIVGATAPATAIYDVIRDGSGYLATGTAGGRGQSDLAVWQSPDGVQWNRLGSTDPVFLEPGFQAGLGIIRARGRIVVAGRHGAGSAGLWVGP